jgi:hypothetical protein
MNEVQSSRRVKSKLIIVALGAELDGSGQRDRLQEGERDKKGMDKRVADPRKESKLVDSFDRRGEVWIF